MGSIIAVLFISIWTVGAVRMGAPWIFPLFGVIGIVMAIAGGIYNLYNATADNRVSEFDFVHTSQEPDPFSRKATSPPPMPQGPGNPSGDRFCPYCGAALAADFKFCPKCGKQS